MVLVAGDLGEPATDQRGSGAWAWQGLALGLPCLAPFAALFLFFRGEVLDPLKGNLKGCFPKTEVSSLATMG